MSAHCTHTHTLSLLGAPSLFLFFCLVSFLNSFIVSVALSMKSWSQIYVYGFTMHFMPDPFALWACNDTKRVRTVEWVLNQKSVIMRFNSFTVLQILIRLCLWYKWTTWTWTRTRAWTRTTINIQYIIFMAYVLCYSDLFPVLHEYHFYIDK